MKFDSKTLKTAREEASKLAQEYDIQDAGGAALLRTYAAARSLEIKCEKLIDRDGLTFKDRFGQIKSHPLLSSLRDARAQKMAALKALELDIENKS